MLQFRAEQLHSVIADLRRDQFSGAAHLQVLPSPGAEHRTRVLAFCHGAITYGGLKLPSPEELAKALGRKFKLQVMDAAIQLAAKKGKDPTSIREFFELFVRLDLFKWKDVEDYLYDNIVLTLEQLLPYPGTLQTDESAPFDFCISKSSQGFGWKQLMQGVTQRQLGWDSLRPIIESMEVAPQNRPEAQQHISDAWVKEHLQQLVDGKRSLVDIGTHIERDPLELAHTYLHWAKMGWICFEQTGTITAAPDRTTSKPDLPTILSVDDSSVVQTMIKRAISDCYNVILANNAVDALGVLSSNSNISLMLLDVTMPDIDGFELCRTVRNISKFRDLPVIMLTAKDGMINKLKGQIAGSTHYLTKPVDREKLLEVIGQYLPSTVVSP